MGGLPGKTMGDDHTALLKFCAAQRELTRLDDATAIERRQHGRSAATFRDLLREQMVSAHATCVPVMLGGQQRYAVLKPVLGGGNVSVTCEAVMRILRELRYDGRAGSGGGSSNSGTTAPPATLEEWAEAALRTVLTTPPSPPGGMAGATGGVAGAMGGAAATGGAAAAAAAAAAADERPKGRLSVVAKRPDGAHAPMHPGSASRIQETALSLHTATEASKALRKQNDVRRKQLRTACKETEESVAQHLQQHDPEYGTRRVKLVQGGAEATCYLRRKQSQRSSKPTVRTALPAIRQTIRMLREEANVDPSPTWDSFRWLTSPATLSRLERHVAQCLAQLHASKKKTRVVLTNVD